MGGSSSVLSLRRSALKGATLASGPSIALEPPESGAADWLREFFGPALVPSRGEPEWTLRINESDAAFEQIVAAIPPDSPLRPCFTFDTQVFEHRVADTPGGLHVEQAERRCALRVGASTVELAGAEGTCRWRMVAGLVVQELTATRLRPTHLELHAAGVEVNGSAIGIVGPKGAGKTSLSVRLLRSGRCRHLCNDRAYAGSGSGGPTLWGVPTAITVRPPLTGLLPELDLGEQWIDRPYLYRLDELRRRPGTRRPAGTELWINPAQFASGLEVERAGSARLAALVFPRFTPSLEGWDLEPVRAADVANLLLGNLYGGTLHPREPTVFEERGAGVAEPPGRVAEEIAREVPSFQVHFGAEAWARERFAVDLLERLGLA